MVDKKLIVDMFLSGILQSSICKELGVHKSYVSNILRDSGHRKTSWTVSEEVFNMVKVGYDSGMSRSDIIDSMSVTEYDVRMILAGKTRTPGLSNHIKAVKNSAEITCHQRQLILGSLLGDASISMDGSMGHRIQISHSEPQAGYMEHKGKILGSNVHPYVNSGFSKLPLWKLTYHNARALQAVASLVMISGKKTINMVWLKQLTMQAIAYWFMDDGSSVWSKEKYVSVSFHTEGFSLYENNILAEWMAGVGFLVIVQKTKNGKFILSMRRQSIPSFMEAMKQYVWPIECMRYKLKMPHFKDMWP